MSLLGCVVCVDRRIPFAVKKIASPEYLQVLKRDGIKFVVLTNNRTTKGDSHNEHILRGKDSTGIRCLFLVERRKNSDCISSIQS